MVPKPREMLGADNTGLAVREWSIPFSEYHDVGDEAKELILNSTAG